MSVVCCLDLESQRISATAQLNLMLNVESVPVDDLGMSGILSSLAYVGYLNLR